VEGAISAGTVDRRTTCNRTLNFRTPIPAERFTGTYLSVRVTRAGPNSLVGESAAVV